MKPRFWCTSALILLNGLALAAPSAPLAGFQANYRRVSTGSIVQDKNFYVLTLLQRDVKARAELAADPALAAIVKKSTQEATTKTANDKAAHGDTGKETAKEMGITPVAGDLKARAEADARSMTFSDDDIAAARTILLRRLPQSSALQAVVEDHLRPSGTYQLLTGRSDAEMLGEAWAEAARGINHIIERFALQTDIHYDDIDSPSYDRNDAGYQSMILDACAAARSAHAAPAALFFEPALDFALRLLAINRRDEAARHEPLATGENRAAMEKMRHIDWGAYPYASLLVHGIGPDEPGFAISSGSRANSAAAAALYKRKMAPFIIVSGGYVHPKQTIFSEAIEMKRDLMFVYGIPESAILVDPQARHTTTNVRNAARILLAAGVPADKPSLSVASKEHIDGIVSQLFAQRCEQVFGYMPAKYGKRISDVAAEFTPSLDSMQIDPRDPMDP